MSWTIQGSNPSRGKRSLFPPKCPDWLWGAPSVLLSEYQGPFPQAVKWSDHEADHSPLSTVTVKNDWSYTSTPPVYLHGVYRDSFYFCNDCDKILDLSKDFENLLKNYHMKIPATW
jgi:hypothetical protein